MESYSYDVFGEPDAISSIGNPYMFTARRYDSETANYYYRARIYKPSIGRFLQPDPIGYDDSMNLYQSFLNNPVNILDPFGKNIKVVQGNDTINPFNNAVHQNIVVDAWDTNVKDGAMQYTKAGEFAFSFGMSGIGLVPPSKQWLGHNSVVLPTIFEGEIYIDDYTTGKVILEKITTPKEDVKYLAYMLSRLGDTGAYSARHSCRTFCNLEFQKAPGKLKCEKK